MTADLSGSRQIPLELPLPARRGLRHYVVGDANRAAFALIELWPDWPSPVTLLIGSQGSGKTHLATIWAKRSEARVFSSESLASMDPPAVTAAGHVAVEDLGEGFDERGLFHLLNAAAEARRSVLLTSRRELASWNIQTPDLLSRLRAATPVNLHEPDDPLLESLLGKLFADRQTVVEASVIRFAATRMERSYAAALVLVDALDRAALSAKSPVTRSLAARILLEHSSREPELPELDDRAKSGNCSS